MGRKHEKSPGDDSGSTVQTSKDKQKVKDRREKTRLKEQAWMKRQRENKAKYDELKKVDRERRQDARLRKRQQALSLIQSFNKNLQRKSVRKKYRQKKKEKAAISLPDPKIAEINKRKIEKKKEAVKRTKAWRMRIKLKDSTKQG
ncbi:splicing regulatory glutamine/lysine-rich protein 1-like [Mya arenaria]|uniref:splicing regulatory glutamine/lysine-rich protein 1-like n=1 Tax=Mya arenaria TaxID=6604 RepID=UPI0022E4FAB2|nr:splicing regulatory glutamine/lysine-rich protein 1-like [Mya arenaria]